MAKKRNMQKLWKAAVDSKKTPPHLRKALRKKLRQIYIMSKKTPKHLKKIIDNSMKTDKGRRNLADLTGASHYRSISGKIVKRRRQSVLEGAIIMSKKSKAIKPTITLVIGVTFAYFIWLSWKMLTDLIGDSFIVWLITGIILLIAIILGYFSLSKIVDKFS